jgi:hypothetical protein
MTNDYRSTKLDELDRLLNDPDLPIRPDMVWGLLNEIIRAGSVDCGHLVVEAASRVGAGEDIHSRP